MLLLSFLLRAQLGHLSDRRNEAQAIGDTRSIISANQTYASANCGLFARTLECLTWDSESGICLPGYPPDAPEFAGPDLARATPYTKAGYERSYTTSDVPEEVPAECDPGSPRFYCYASVPIRVGVTGDRSFVGTAPGAIYVDYDGADTNCIPADAGALLEDPPASIGPPPSVSYLGEPAPFSYRRSARGLSRLFAIALEFFAPVFVVMLAAYFIYLGFQRAR